MNLQPLPNVAWRKRGQGCSARGVFCSCSVSHTADQAPRRPACPFMVLWDFLPLSPEIPHLLVNNVKTIWLRVTIVYYIWPGCYRPFIPSSYSWFELLTKGVSSASLLVARIKCNVKAIISPKNWKRTIKQASHGTKIFAVIFVTFIWKGSEGGRNKKTQPKTIAQIHSLHYIA